MNAQQRAQGALLGQLAGDALGSLVEFQGPEQIRRRYPQGVRDLADGGTWDTLAGQPTDDSELALMLARSLVAEGTYHLEKVRERYYFWYQSDPFDIGHTTRRGLRGDPDPSSQANGALMRISPLGIFGANRPLSEVAAWAAADSRLTHPHPICQQSNALYAMAIAFAVAEGPSPEQLYQQLQQWSEELAVEPAIREWIADAASAPPADYLRQQGWVRIAFHNALWQLLHAPNLEEAIMDSVMRGGDTDTNAAICGALLGAVQGLAAIPERWRDCLLHCTPQAGRPGVQRPRPRCFWPVDALELAEQLLAKGQVTQK